MPRIPRRVRTAGYRVFHVTAKGVEGRPIFMDDADRRVFLTLLAEAAKRFRVRVHASCLMGNHLHVVVECDPPELSRLMHRVLFRYAMRFNRRHRRWGHLFGDRFASKAVDSERYLEAVCLYTFRNPVRAGLCAHPGDWPWSGGRLFGRLYRRSRAPARVGAPAGAATLA